MAASDRASTWRLDGRPFSTNNGDNRSINVYARALMNVVAGGAFLVRRKFVSVVDFCRFDGRPPAGLWHWGVCVGACKRCLYMTCARFLYRCLCHLLVVCKLKRRKVFAIGDTCSLGWCRTRKSVIYFCYLHNGLGPTLHNNSRAHARTKWWNAKLIIL